MIKQSARRRTTVLQDMSAPTAVVRNLLQRLLSVWVVVPLCCALPAVKEAAFHFSLLLFLSHIRELTRELRFFFWWT